MTETTLGHVLATLGEWDWRDWIYLRESESITVGTKCIVINPDDADLGHDDFAPRIVEEAAMDEFLSVQDLKSVVANLSHWTPNATLEQKCEAAVYFFRKNAFFPPKTK